MSHPSATASKGQHYFVPAASHYSTTLSIGIFLMALGLILKVNGVPTGAWAMPLGALMIVYVLFGWFGEIIAENMGGKYTHWEDRSYRTGMVWFIFSEVMFFACFFGRRFGCGFNHRLCRRLGYGLCCRFSCWLGGCFFSCRFCSNLGFCL